jgi:adiponectin receptor
MSSTRQRRGTAADATATPPAGRARSRSRGSRGAPSPVAIASSPAAAVSADAGAASRRWRTFSELAPAEFSHLADNPAIRSGYRAGLSMRDAALSVFSLHNETWNIWTHGLGALFFVVLLAHWATGGLEVQLLARGVASAAAAMHLPGSAADAPPPLLVPLWPIGVFLASAVACLSISTLFHTLHVVNRRVFEVLARADYTGIALLIGGSNVPCLWYGFWCNPNLQVVYIIAQAVLCVICVAVGMLDAFQAPSWRLHRMSLFVATASFGSVPLFHLLAAGALQVPGLRVVGEGLGSMGVQYITGALLYGFRIPEQFFPGRFDILSSHGIFHVLVATAAYTHYTSVTALYAWRMDNTACPAPGPGEVPSFWAAPIGLPTGSA